MAKKTAALARISPRSPTTAKRRLAKPPAKTPSKSPARKVTSIQPPQPDPCTTVADVLHSRTLFWHDCVRQMLTGLSSIQATHPEIFDGRTAVLTHGGERIPIAEVFPLFACGLPNSPQAKAASLAVECTIFRIRTPSGEVFTIPVHEVRALHSLTPELIQQLEQTALTEGDTPSSATPNPFGFAAHTPRPSHLADPVDAAI